MENIIQPPSETESSDTITENIIQPPSETESSGVLVKDQTQPLIPDTLVIKGKFKFQNAGIYGVFAVLLDKSIDSEENLYKESETPVLYTNILASYFSDFYYTDITEPWSNLENVFNNIQIQGNYAASVTSVFQNSLNNDFSRKQTHSYAIIDDYNLKKYEQIKITFENLLSPIYKDKQITLEIKLEEVFRDDITSIKQSRITDETPVPNIHLLESSPVTVNHANFRVLAYPTLAPIEKGIVASQLSQGIRILMKLDPTTSYGQQWVSIFKAYNKRTNTIIPIVATVEQVGSIINNSVNILVTYQENQYTKFNIEAGVKLKLYDPNSGELVIDPLVSYHQSLINQEEVKDFKFLFQDPYFKFMVFLGSILLIVSLIILYFI